MISSKYAVEQFCKSHCTAHYKSITEMTEEYPVPLVHEITVENQGYKQRFSMATNSNSQWPKNKLRSIK